MPSGEMVAPMIDSFLRDKARHLPLNLPERGPVPRPAADAVGRERCARVDGDGRARPRRRCTRRPCWPRCCAGSSASQELTVEAAVTGDRDKVVEAMLLDPLAGRIDFDQRRADDRRDARGDARAGSRSSRR